MVQKLVFGAFNFTAPDSTNGIEPWVTDGTAAGTFLLKDINLGSSGSNPTSFFSVNGKVVFYATTPTNGSELWVTDGTSEGTTLLADINPGSGSAGVNALNFTTLGNKLLFTATNPATGIELWVTDGTPAGTQLLRDILPGPGSGAVQSKPLSILGNAAVFGADGDVWSTDGTPTGTVKIFDFNTATGNAVGAFTDSFYQANGLVYFTAVTTTVTGVRQVELWVTDGTSGGTRSISNLGSDLNTSVAVPLGTLGNATFFVAQVTALDGTTVGSELYVSTGTSLDLFRDFVPGFATGYVNPDPTRVAVAGNQLFFTREIPAVGNPTELWVIDGATGSTQLLQTFTNITGSKFSVFGDSIVFTATTTVNGVQSSFAPWISDGTAAGTQQLLATNPTASGNSPDAGNFTPFAGKLFFTAIGGSSTGKELWVTDGTPAGTVLFKDINPGAAQSSPSNFVVVGDKLFFQATTATGREYWVTDGTPEGTVLVNDIASGALGSVNTGGRFTSAVLGDAAPAAPTYAISDAPSTAEGGTLTFTVTRDIGTAAGTLALALGGTATANSDYQTPALTLSFAAGETVKTVTIATLPDAIADPNETLTLTLGTITGGGTVSATNGTATGTITDVPPPPTYAITGTPSTAEGGTLTFTVTRDIGTAAGTVAFALGGTATSGADYTAPTQTLSFAAGETVKTVTIATLPDAIADPNETLTLTLGTITGGGTVSATNSTATGTITDVPPPPTYAITGTPTAAEGGTLTFSVTRDIGTAAGTVAFALGGTATSGADYTAPTQTVSFAAGETVKTVTIATLPDAIADPNETLTLTLGTITGGGTVSATNGTVTGTITDAHISLTQLGLAYTQDFNSLQSFGTSGSLPFGWIVKETGANANGLYTASSGQSNGGDSYSFGASASDDRALGSLQSGSLSSVFGASFVNDTATTVTQLEIAFRGEQWRLGTANRLDSLKFEISLDATAIDNGTWQSVSALDFQTVDSLGTVGARDGNTAANGTVVTSILDGLSIKAGSIFFIRWTDIDATGADDGLAVDDFSLTPKVFVPPTYAITGTSTTAEGGTLTFTVTRDIGTAAGTIALALGGTATANADYQTPALTLSFAAGETSKTVTINTLKDTVAEGNETLTLTLGTITGGGSVNAANGTATGTITNVAPPADPGNDAFTTISGVDLTFTLAELLANDRNVSSFAGIQMTSEQGGMITAVPGGYVYRAPTGFVGIDSFTYSVTGADGEQVTATVSIGVTPDPVNAVDDTFTTISGVPLTFTLAQLLANDTGTAGVAGLQLATASGGTITFENGAYIYRSPTGFTGIDSFTYNAQGFGGTQDSATVFITVTPDPVNPEDDAFTTIAGVPLSITPAELTANDVGVVSIAGVPLFSAQGALVSFENGAYVYRPLQGFTGSDFFTYNAVGVGGTQVTTTVRVLVTPDPVNPGEDAFTTIAGVPLTITPAELTANDTGVVSIAGVPLFSAQGALVSFENGAYVYRPLQGFTGWDFFTYNAVGVGGTQVTTTVRVLVTPDPNITPVDANDDSFTTIAGVPLSITAAELTANDVGVVSIGSVPLFSANGAPVSFDNGAYVYRPLQGFTGTDFFTYTATGAGGARQTATVFVNVTPDPVAPVNDVFTTIAGVPLSITPAQLTANDVGVVSIGSVTLFSATGALVSFENGAHVYRPLPGFTGTDFFTYKAQGIGGTQVEATVTVNVTPDPVDPEDDAFTTIAGVPLTITPAELTANDVGVVQIASVTLFSANGALVSFENGAYVYRPPQGFTGTDFFTYKAQGIGGTQVEATVTVNVTPSINAPPVGANDSYTTTYQKALNILVANGVLENDTDPNGDALTVVGVQTDVANGTLVLNANGSFTYTPDAGFFGADSFVYTVQDSKGLQSTATVTIAVEVPDFNVVSGSRAVQSLRGTEGSDVLLMGNTRFATMLGGQGADVFVFGETANNRFESAVIRDYQVGVDAIDLGRSTIARSFETANSVTLLLRGGDLLTILGVNDADKLTFTDVWSNGHNLA
jgi:ELWxxDGT repeat protein